MCGGGEIRTHGTLAGTTVFKTAAFNHSATPPYFDFYAEEVGLEPTDGVLNRQRLAISCNSHYATPPSVYFFKYIRKFFKNSRYF